ncbi:MAG: sulfurtransferase TusA family protein [Maritimibacter sp.]
MKFDLDIDAIGLLCPLPVLRLRKALLAAKPGQVVRLMASDEMAQIDVPHFCAESGYELLESATEGRALHFLVRKPQ